MKVDYDKLAHQYDSHRWGGGPYMRRLLSLAQAASSRHVLEVGSGTGNNTEAFLAAHPCNLIGLELSRGMIHRARDKGIVAAWIQGSTTDIPLAAHSVDFVFGVYVLHYVPDLRLAFGECKRVMRGGYAAFVTASHDFIGRHPMNRYFPSFAKLDQARFQPVEQILEAFADAGFADANAERFIDVPRPIGPEYVERVANKFISTYELLPPDEYEAGLRRLRADVEARGRLDVEMEWESTVVWARKG